MDSLKRFACQVRLLGEARTPLGCGFICGSRHVLSCTHVVEDCLGESVSVGASVSVSFPIAQGHEATLRVRAFRPIESFHSGKEMDPMNDLCLLELDEKSSFPKAAVAVTALPDSPEDDTRIHALGLGRLSTEHGELSDDAGEVDIKGALGGFETLSRRRLYSGEKELSVRPGCSGTGAFAAGNLVGMVVEKQERQTALIIPVEVLTGMWNFELRTPGSEVPVLSSKPTESFVRVNLVKPFEEFDRVDQVSTFKLAFKESWKKSSSALMCTIAGLDDDLPMSCRDRLRLEMRPSLEAMGINFATFVPDEIRWPQRDRFDVVSELARMKNSLVLYAGSDEQSAAAICQGLNDTLQPMALYSEIDQRHWSRRHIILLKRWGDLLQEISSVPGKTLEKPLIHFLIIRFDARDFAPLADEPAARLRRFYELVDVEVNERGRHRRLTPIDMLNDFNIEYVKTWLTKVGGRLALSEDHIASLKRQAGKRLPPGPLRMKAVEDWVYRLSRSGRS